MLIVQGLIGLALLAFGRKGLAFCLGAIGFVAGMSLTTRLFDTASPGLVIAIAIAGGVIGVFIAFAIQKVATVLVGILGGGYIGLALADSFGWSSGGFPWIPVVVAAVLGVLLAFFLLKWALIVFSSLVRCIPGGRGVAASCPAGHAAVFRPCDRRHLVPGPLGAVKKEGRTTIIVFHSQNRNSTRV